MGSSRHDADASPPVGAGALDLASAAVEAKALRRKLSFWRRTVALLLGATVVVLGMMWRQGSTRRAACRVSLAHFAALAKQYHLDTTPVALLKDQWHRWGLDSVSVPAWHYELVVDNWIRVPKPGERVPLAVCSQPHRVMFSLGRHVLFRDGSGEHVEWVPEEQATPILQQAFTDEGGP
ncbi:MAG: hypothetical protein ACE5EX_11020 [Phycisphaerae bacterium]